MVIIISQKYTEPEMSFFPLCCIVESRKYVVFIFKLNMLDSRIPELLPPA